MNTFRFLLATTVAVLAVGLPVAGASAATPDPGPAFGQHVAGCATTMGFTGAHNPGMHQGKSGWMGGMTCPMPTP